MDVDRSDMYDAIRCAAAPLLVVGTRSQHARRACAGFDLARPDLDSRPFDATIWSVRGVRGVRAAECLLLEVPVCGAEKVE